MQHSTHAIQLENTATLIQHKPYRVNLEYKEIHNAIHNPEIREYHGFPITRASNGCRTILYSGIRFMEQNKAKNSIYASMAREGKHITWGMQSGQWIYIDDNTEVNP